MKKQIRDLLIFIAVYFFEIVLSLQLFSVYGSQGPDFGNVMVITFVAYFLWKAIEAGLITGRNHFELINKFSMFALGVYLVFSGLMLLSSRHGTAILLPALEILGAAQIVLFFISYKLSLNNRVTNSSESSLGSETKICSLSEEENPRHNTKDLTQEATDTSNQETPSQTQSKDLTPIQDSDFSQEDKLAFERAKKYEKRLGLKIKPVQAKLPRVEIIKAKIPALRQYFDRYIKKAKKAITSEKSFATRSAMTSEFLEDIGYYTLSLLFNEAKINTGTENEVMNEVKNEEVVQYFLKNYSSLNELFDNKIVLDAWLDGRKKKFRKCAYPNYDELKANEKNNIENELDNLQSRSILFALDVFGPLFDIDFDEGQKETKTLPKK